MSSSFSRDKMPSKPSSGIRTLADLNRPPSAPGSDGPQEYYPGGEKSGMHVQDPSKGNQDADAIFEQARQLGAEEGPVDNLRLSSSSTSFTGTGRLLSGETVQSAPQQPESVFHNIGLWNNGFTVNDGPLRRFDDPENAPFFESIRKSELPKELEPADRRPSVHVKLIRRHENCPEPPTSTPSPSPGLSVDTSLPSTSIRLRLADGTGMVARFDLHHTIGDIRAFIDASRPGATRAYQLQTVDFPPKQLPDMTQTIEQAGLGNSVVIQKF